MLPCSKFTITIRLHIIRSASIWVVITEVPLLAPKSATFAPSKCHFRTLKVPLRTANCHTSSSNLCYFSLQTMRFQPPNHAFPASKLPFHAQPLHSTVGYGKGVGGLSNYFYNNYTLTPNMLFWKPLYLKAFPNVFKLSTPNKHLT